MPDQGGLLIVRTRRTAAAIVFGFMTLLLVLALVVAETAQQTTSGRITAAVFFGLFIAGTVGTWLGVARGGRRLEVGRDAIATRPGAKGKPFTLPRSAGGTLRILPQFTLLGATRGARLVFLGTGGSLSLRGLPLDKVRDACEAQGWRFDGDTALVVKDVQGWLHGGLSAEAGRLIEVFGPFPSAAADDEAHTSLEAAVFEDLGDKLSRTSRANARAAFRRAAAAQRAFADLADSAGERADRLAQANRIDGKAQG